MIHSNGTMVISGTLYKDAGMYVCQAKNVLGMAKLTMLLIVHGMFHLSRAWDKEKKSLIPTHDPSPLVASRMP